MCWVGGRESGEGRVGKTDPRTRSLLDLKTIGNNQLAMGLTRSQSQHYTGAKMKILNRKTKCDLFRLVCPKIKHTHEVRQNAF